MMLRLTLIATLTLWGCSEDTRPRDASTDSSVTVDSSTGTDSSSPDGSGGGACGGETCEGGSFCCGPPECGFCAPEGSGVFCGFTCDAGTTDGGGTDAGEPTACDPADPTTCEGDLGCECCGDVGPTAICICTTTCTSSSDCTDPARPFCNLDPTGSMGVCTTSTFMCCWGCD